MRILNIKLSVILLALASINLIAAQKKGNKALNQVYVKMQQQDYAGAAATAEKAANAAKNNAEEFEAFVVINSVKAAKDKSPLPKKAIQQKAKKLSINKPEQYAGLNSGAKALTCSRDYKLAKALLTMANKLVDKKETKIIKCRYRESVPLGAGGWMISDFIKDPKNRESRLYDYNEKAAARLFTDVTADRSYKNNTGKKAYYFKNTGFYMVYDHAGWHIFVLSGEPDIEELQADGKGAGALEMFFSPGESRETYYQWILDLPNGKANCIDWNSPHRNFRPLKNYFKTDTVVSGKNIGTYIFIPWEMMYDKLPLNGEKWRFGFIRWSLAGGLTWGGKVHETGKWGLVDWQKPTPEQSLLIKKNILRKAFGKYKNSKKAQLVFWADEVMGDLKFYNEVLKPKIAQLDKDGEKIKGIKEMNAKDLNKLYREVVSDWMEFDYLVDELRHDYLQQQLVTQK